MARIKSKKLFDTDLEFTREQFVSTARTFVGQPYVSQGKGFKGTDCGWLLLAVGHRLGYTDLEVTGYKNSPDGETYEALLAGSLDEVIPKWDVRKGDIIACDYGQGIQHVAIFVQRDSPTRLLVIHAKRIHGVVEQYLHGRDYRAWAKTFRLRNFKESL
jgi:cell wall-associated NlpC family hydrolase